MSGKSFGLNSHLAHIEIPVDLPDEFKMNKKSVRGFMKKLLLYFRQPGKKIRLYRGTGNYHTLNITNRKNIPYSVGSIVDEPTFLSTSMDLNVAKEFIRIDGKGNRYGIIHVFDISSNVPVLDMSRFYNICKFDKHPEILKQKEIVLPPIKWILIKKRKTKKICFYYWQHNSGV
jgi:hypothetical protein